MEYWEDRKEEEEPNSDSEDSNAEDYYDRICDAYGYEESEEDYEWDYEEDWDKEEEWDENEDDWGESDE